jgi:cobalt-precorrin 5A hydrolase / precorrin-3B C17-methyltransferase
MTVAILAATGNGRRHAAHLVAALDDAVLLEVGPGARETLAAAWGSHDAFVLCMATGAAVRLIAPLLDDKRTDPAVVTVDDAGRFAVALAGGHHGANDLAALVAGALGAEPVITTASEALGLPALDTLGAAFGLRLDPALADVAAVGSALAGGEPVSRWREQPWPTGPLPGAVTDVGAIPDAEPPAILVTDRVLPDPPRPAVCYRPPSLVVGVGGSRGVPAEEVGALIDAALADAGLSPLSVAHVATVDAKADEAGILAAAAARGWAVVTHPAEVLEEVAVPNPSDVVREAVGTPSVAEAAALVDGGALLVPKRVSERADGAPAMATVAIARRPVRGRLALVSTGPGDPDLLPEAARRALSQAEVVVGLDQYVDRIRPWLRPGCEVLASPIGDEVARARDAVEAARAGRSAVLLSGGDVGVYAMGSPALEVLGDDRSVDVVVVPGVTAAVAAAALLGSPLGHDHCAISLSDLLTPWEVIRRRVKAAAEGDFVVTFYNPRSRGRDWQLGEARLLLLEHRKPDTPVGIVTDASRPTQKIIVTTLGELDVEQVDMLTCVVIGNSQTRIEAGRIVTPRGYA